jgi:hypothetical protein
MKCLKLSIFNVNYEQNPHFINNLMKFYAQKLAVIQISYIFAVIFSFINQNFIYHEQS